MSGDCASDGPYLGHCLSPMQFPGGYCVLPCAHGFGCPADHQLCRPLVRNGSADACFQQCGSDGDCRVVEGHHCCPSWAMGGAPGDVCYPGACP